MLIFFFPLFSLLLFSFLCHDDKDYEQCMTEQNESASVSVPKQKRVIEQLAGLQTFP